MAENTDLSATFKSRYPDSTEPDANVAVNFLVDVSNGGYLSVVAVPVNEHAKETIPRAITYDLSDASAADEMRSFIRFQETQPHNVFFAPNMAVYKEPNRFGVPRKNDIELIREIILDFDPDKALPLADERMRLRGVADMLVNGRVPPRSIIDTGGGMQARWMLRDPIYIDLDDPKRDARIDEIESLMRRLARALGADTATCTVKNLFRVPGTKNWPTAAKRKAGREISVSGLWHVGFSETALDDLRALCVTGPEDDPTDAPQVDLEGVTEAHLIEVLGQPKNLPKRLLDLVAAKPGLAAAVKRPDIKALDTSGEDHELCMTLARFQIRPGDMALLLCAYGAKVHKTFHEEHRLFSYVRTTVSKAWRLANGALEFVDNTVIDEEQAAKDREAAAKQEQARFDRFKPLNRDAFKALHHERKPALVDGLLDRHGMSVVYGASGSGKTFVVLDIGTRISNGMLVLGRKVTQCAVVYIAAESPASVEPRWDAIVKTYGETPNFYVISATPNLFDLKTGDLDAVGKQIAGLHLDIGLIIVDTLARVMIGGNENSTEDMSLLVSNGDKLRDAFKCNVMWVHHSGKDESLGARGSSALRAATDTEIEISKGWFDVTKLRNDSSFKHKFELQTGIEVGSKLDGSPRTSCVVQWLEGSSIGSEGKPKPEAAMRDVIVYLMGKAGKPMTIGDIRAAAELEGVKLGTAGALKQLLMRSCGNEKERIFKVMGQEPTTKGKVAHLYGLYDW